MHHAEGDSKKLAVSQSPPEAVPFARGSGGAPTHYKVTWTQGLTQSGSSGEGCAIWAVFAKLLRAAGGGQEGVRRRVVWGAGLVDATLALHPRRRSSGGRGEPVGGCTRDPGPCTHAGAPLVDVGSRSVDAPVTLDPASAQAPLWWTSTAGWWWGC